MSQVLYISETRRDEILVEAVAKQTPVVLTRRGPQGWTVAKSKFCGHQGHHRHLLVARPSDCDARTWPAAVQGELLGVAFRRGHKKCLFSSMVTKEHVDAPEVPGPAFAIQWPQDVQEMQRRVYQRATPPPGRRIDVGFRPADTGSDDGNQWSGTLEDLSAGGVRVRSAEQPRLGQGQSVCVTFALNQRSGEFAIDATYRHCEAVAGGGWSLGFQFVGLETSPEGRGLLARIARVVTDFQRAAHRRPRKPLRSGGHPR